LDLSEPSQYAVATRLVFVCHWESAVAKAARLPDVSQHGGRLGLRNVTLNRSKQVVTDSFVLPGDGYVGEGMLHADYSTPLIGRFRSKQPTLEPHQVLALEYLFGDGELGATERDRVDALRLMSPRFLVDAAQAKLIMRKITSQRCRADVYCALHARAVDFGAPWVGRPTPPKDAPGVLHDVGLNDSQIGMLGEILGLPVILDFRGVHVGPWNRFHLDLRMADHRVVCSFLVSMNAAEQACNLEGIVFHNTNNHDRKPVANWAPPATWSKAKDIPAMGILQCGYVMQQKVPDKELNTLKDARGKFARVEVGWVSNK